MGIVNATNQYVTTQQEAEPRKHKSQWSPVDIRAICMGLAKKTHLKDYWTRILELASPFFSQAMERNEIEMRA